jgi:hypothetical protein
VNWRVGWIVVALSLVFAPSPMSGQDASTMNIRLMLDGKAIHARLHDNTTARDVFSLLPITVTLEDYNAAKKINDRCLSNVLC